MTCVEKGRLAFEYEAATTKLAETMRQLRRSIETSTKHEYDGLQRASDKARVKSGHTRVALEQHVAEHNC